MNVAKPIHPALFTRVVDGLYIEAMVMADEARSYFDSQCDEARAAMDVMTRLSFTCESLKVTTRLMHVIAWLLTQRAWQRGEISWVDLADPRHMLGEPTITDAETLATLPVEARELVLGSADLFDRVRRLQDNILAGQRDSSDNAEGPARALQSRLENLL